jgi:cytoskeletal protein RodZ
MQQESSTAPTKPKRVVPGTGQKKRRKRSGILNLLLFVGIIGAVALFFWAEQQRRDALGKLQETEQQLQEIKESTERNGQEVADEVLNNLKEHMEIPEDPKPTVATIIDVDRLRETSDFYKSAENGDHLILTENRAILFDPNNNIIIDVVPVVLDAEGQDAAEGEQESDANLDADGNVIPQNGQNANPGAQVPGNTNNDASGPDTQIVPADGNVPPAP